MTNDSQETNECRFRSLAEIGGRPLPRSGVVEPRLPHPVDSNVPFVKTVSKGRDPRELEGNVQCTSCRAILRCVSDAAEGRCPVCGEWIEMRASAEVGPVFEVVDNAGGERKGPPDGHPPAVPRIQKSGVMKFHAFVAPSKDSIVPDFDKEGELKTVMRDQNCETSSSGARSMKLFLCMGLVLVGILISTGYWMSLNRTKIPDPITSPPAPIATLREQWRDRSIETLKKVLSSEDPEQMAEWVIGGEEKSGEIKDYLEKHPEFPRYAESDLLVPNTLRESDVRDGIHSLIYQPVEPLELMPGRPLMPVVVENPSLLEVGSLMSRSTVRRPRRALALFRSEGDRMLLDWDTFVQTWDRSLMSFKDGELGDGPMRFRVILSQDLPVFENGETHDKKVVRIQDPLNRNDVIRVQIDEYDPVFMEMRLPREVMEANPSAGMQLRTATVDLVRNVKKEGRIQIDDFVCWEFLGVGVEEAANAGSETADWR